MEVADDKECVPEDHNKASVFKTPGPERLLGQILDRCVRAIIAISSDRSLLYQNAAARILTARQDLIEVREGRLRFVDRNVLARVESHIAGTVPTSRRRVTDSTSLALQTYARAASDQPRSSYRVLVTPLDSRTARSALETIWLVFVSELSSERFITVEVLTQLYGLTPSESMLSMNLFSGRTLEEAARAQDISINTAKTHLRQIFQKCGVQSQANLLQLLALGPRAF